MLTTAIAFAVSAGEFDTTFSDDGAYVDPVGDPGPSNRPGARFWDAVVQPDGKTVFAGDATPSQFLVLRLKADGTPDESFSGDGKLMTRFGLPSDEYVQGTSVAIQPDGKIVVGGYWVNFTSQENRVFVARVTPEGELDSSFDGDGYLIRQLSDGAFQSAVSSVLVQPDGKIVLVGRARKNNQTVPLVARLKTDGAPDDSFGTSGQFTPQIASDAQPVSTALAAALQPDGKIMITGQASDQGDGFTNGSFVARVEADGKSLDPTWGNGGKIVGRFGQPVLDHATKLNAIALYPGGRVAVAGSSIDHNGNPNGFVARLKADGTDLDPSFGTGGAFIEDAAGNSSFADVLTQPDGRVLAVGGSNTSAGVGMIFVRLTGAGARDTEFTSTGRLFRTFQPSGYFSSVFAAALDPAGKAIGAGSADFPVNGHIDTHAVAARVILNLPPVAAVTAVPSSSVAGQAVTFDSAGSSDPEGRLATYDWDFGDGSTGTGATATHSYGTPGSYTAKLTVRDDYGLTSTATTGITVAPVNSTPPATGAAAPVIGGLTLKPRVFAAARKGGSVAKTARGTTVRYRDSLAATTTFTVARASSGRKVGKRCVAKTRRNRSRKPCTRYVRVRGSFKHVDQAGVNSFRFTGRLRKRPLPRGSYRLTATPRVGTTAGKAVSIKFRIVR